MQYPCKNPEIHIDWLIDSKSSNAPSSTSFSRLPNLQQDCWVVRISHLRQRLGGTKLIWWGELQNWSGQNYKQVFSQSGDPFSCCFLHLPFSWANNIWSEICDQLLLWYFLSEIVWHKTFFSREDEMILLHPNSHLAPRRNKCELINAFTANAKCIQLDIST